MSRKLYLDDLRPCPSGYDVVRSYDEFVAYIDQHGVPDFISFDHDLGKHPKTGMDCARYITDNGLPLPKNGWAVHSMNPVGRLNILGLPRSYEKHVKGQNGYAEENHVQAFV